MCHECISVYKVDSFTGLPKTDLLKANRDANSREIGRGWEVGGRLGGKKVKHGTLCSC